MAAGLLGVTVAPDVAAANLNAGAVYVLSNQPTGNEVLVYERAADGSLRAAGSVDAGGVGTGGGLGSQGAVILDSAGRYLCTEYLAQLRATIDALGHAEPDDLPDEAVDGLVEIYRRWRQD